MGNQNTSGIVEEKKAANKVLEKSQLSSPRDQEEENQIVKIGVGERIDFQEKAAEADSQDSEAEHRIKSAEKEVSEEHKGYVNEDAETQTATLPNFTNVELKESNSEEYIISELNNEIHDQPCTLKEEKQTSEENAKPKSTLTIDITLESQEDQNTLANEIVETLQVITKENDHDELSTISLQNLCVMENEKQNECSLLAEEKQTTNELGNWDETSCVEQTQPFDQETDQMATIDQTDDKKIGEKNEVEINESALKSDPSDVLVQTHERSNPMAENDQEDDMSSSGEIMHETSHDMEKYISNSQFSTEIEQGAEIEQNTNGQKPIIILDDIEKLNIESISSYKGGQVELKKSPSFDFRLPFDVRPEESDQTPLLYNGTATGSFSSCSAMRFQNRSVQTEHYEAVEVEEKTIRMERSNSESSSRPNLSLNLQNIYENVNVVTKAKQENGSPSREDCDVIWPKQSGKRKPRSTFFTTCICCTAAIS